MRKKNFLLLGIVLLFSSCFTPRGIYHIVKPGQTLYSIAKAYNVELYKVMEINNIKDPTKIKPGDKIFIPGAINQRYVPSTTLPWEERYSCRNVKEKNLKGKERPIYRVEKKKNYFKKSRSSQIEERVPSPGKKQETEKKAHASVLQLPKFFWPLKGKVVSKFGWRGARHHDGIDIAAPEGTPVKASASGIVIYSSNGLRGYGNMIVIKHGPRIFTVYAHNKVNLVKKGQRVKKGEIIARVGKTGNATGPHLHFEIRIGTRPVDPLKYLP